LWKFCGAQLLSKSNIGSVLIYGNMDAAARKNNLGISLSLSLPLPLPREYFYPHAHKCMQR